MSMIALSGTRTSSLKLCPSGLANVCTVTSRGMAWAKTRVAGSRKRVIKSAARRVRAVRRVRKVRPKVRRCDGSERTIARFALSDALFAPIAPIAPPHLFRGVRPRPDHALVLLRDRRHAFVDEFLEAFPFPGFRRVDVALRVRGDAVHAVELARLPPAVAERRQLLQRLPIDDADDVVHAIGHVDVLLFRIFRERDIPHGPGALGVLREP